MTRHAMIDIETLDTKSSALVLTIGVVVYNPEILSVGNYDHSTDNVEYRLDLTQQLLAGRTVSPDTVAWWNKQSPEARAALYTPAITHPRDALNGIADLLARHSITDVWANGPDFDIVILNSMADSLGVPKAINFKHGRCYRTYRSLFKHLLPAEYNALEVGAAHNALDDAMYQAVGQAYIHRALKDKMV